MLKNKITWIVIAGVSRAKLLLKNNDNLTRVLPIHHLMDVIIHLDKGASTSGKTSFSIPHGLDSYPTHSDWYKITKEVFMHKIAAILNKAEKNIVI